MGYPPMPVPGQQQPQYAPPPAAPAPQQYAPQPQPPMTPQPSAPAMGGSFSFADLINAAEQAGFILFPEGDYDVVVHAAEAGKNSKGNTRIRVWFTIVTGPYAGSQARIRNDFNISPDNGQALGFFFRHMEAMGLPKEYFAQNPTPQQVAQALVGRPCRVHVKADREYNGTKQNDVTNVMPATATQQYSQPQYGVPAGYGYAPQPAQQFAPAPQFAPVPDQQFATQAYSPQSALPQTPQQPVAPPPAPQPPAPAPAPAPQPPAFQPPAPYPQQAPPMAPPAAAPPVAPPAPPVAQPQGPAAPPLPPSF